MDKNNQKWSLPDLLSALHSDIEQRLSTVRKVITHPGAKGDASENIWLKLLQDYLPQRYEAETAHVVDSNGNFSEQIDIVVFDRQYSPFIFTYEDQKFIPAESVYAVFEAKQTMNAGLVAYAQKKIASVRTLYRTSLPIPHAGGTYPPKPLIQIIGGILTLESEWSPKFGEPLQQALCKADQSSRIDIGCVAAHGTIRLCEKESYCYELTPQKMPATAFLFDFISLLQSSATVPMIDINAYAKWLDGNSQ